MSYYCPRGTFKQDVHNITADLKLNVALAAATNVKVVLTDRASGHSYEADKVTDVDGNITLNVADFPAGLLERDGGVYITVQNEAGADLPMTLTGIYNVIDLNTHIGGTFTLEEVGEPNV
jgi:hypothetical protein